jgi:hypothetical protein
MVDNRAAILTGAKAAHTLHRDLGIREQIERAGGGRVDVFAAIAKLGATLMFQPLDKLLGAYPPGEELGVLITTKRPLPVQRFTGAHELGHLYMRHKPSLDDENILRRAPFSTAGRTSRQEREADAFASMFLTPAWLVALNLQRQGWSARNLADPPHVYQASLRLGTSYRATCYALERHKVINHGQCERLIDVEPKEIKQHVPLHRVEVSPLCGQRLPGPASRRMGVACRKSETGGTRVLIPRRPEVAAQVDNAFDHRLCGLQHPHEFGLPHSGALRTAQVVTEQKLVQGHVRCPGSSLLENDFTLDAVFRACGHRAG